MHSFSFSLTFQLPISLNIYNWRQDIDLISPVYFIRDGRWHIVPDQEIDNDAVMRNILEFNSGQDIPEGALVYRVQRKHIKSGRLIQDEFKHIQLLVARRTSHTEGLDVRAVLIENNKKFDWNEDKLRQLYQKCWHPLDILDKPIQRSWLLDDATVLITVVRIMNGGYRWDIFIPEERSSGYIMRPLWINTKR
jgi:hypothetical protein